MPDSMCFVWGKAFTSALLTPSSNTRKWSFVLLCLLLWNINNGYAQKPLPHLVHASDFLNQLPRFAYYDIAVDSTNYVYAATNAGVLQFNGTEFKGVFPPDSIPYRASDAFFKDYKGRIWAKAIKAGFSVLEGGELVPYQHSKQIEPLLNGRIETCYVDSTHTMHLAPRGKGYFKVSRDGVLQEVLGRPSGLHGFVVTRLPDGKPFYFSIFNREMDARKEKLNLYYLDAQDSLHTLTTWNTRPVYHSSLAEHQDGSISLSIGTHEMATFKEDSLINFSTYGSPILKLFADEDNALWVGTLKAGLNRVQNLEFDKPNHFLGTSTSAVVAQDLTGGLWITSDSGYFHYIPSTKVCSYGQSRLPIKLSEIRHVATDFDRVFLMGRNPGLTILSSDSVEYVPIPKNKIPYTGGYRPQGIFSTFYDKGSETLWLGDRGRAMAYDGERWTIHQLPDTLARIDDVISGIVTLPDGSTMACCRAGILHIRPDQENRFIRVQDESNYIICITADDTGKVWLGCNRGLFYLSEADTLTQFSGREADRDMLHRRITSIAFGLGRLWFDSKEYPFQYLEDGKVQVLIDSAGLWDELTEVVLGPRGNVWGRTGNPKMRLIEVSEENGELAVHTYKLRLTNWVMESVRKFRLAVTNNAVFQLTDRQIQVTNRQHLDVVPPAPEVLIEQVFVNHNPVSGADFYDLPPNQNSVHFVFEPINYTLKKIKFAHRLVGWDEEWQESMHNEIQYTNLDPGDYQFQVEFQTSSDDWAPGPVIDIHIQTPYYETWWFRTLALLALIGIIGLGFYLRYRVLSRRSLMLIDKLKADQRALRAQMNPHFLFNALSSIQELVFSKDKMFAVTNISMFAQLMRKILVHSSQEVITLEEEIELLSFYLRLESLRFSENFHYEFLVSDSVDPTTRLLPPLMLQPHVENAIKHGLLRANPPGGNLVIRFSAKNGGLLCEVEDDGIGRVEAKKIKEGLPTAHQSFGLQALEERISLLNMQQTEKITLAIVDLKVGERPVGTRVELFIP